jgi:hypothetical protein
MITLQSTLVLPILMYRLQRVDCFLKNEESRLLPRALK